MLLGPLKRHLSAPFLVCLAVTGKCNLACKHCSARTLQSAREMNDSELLDLVRQFDRAKVPQVAIFGGEPLLRPNLIPLVRELKKFPRRISLNTNATLIDGEAARALVTAGIDKFVVSIDGTKRHHDQQRGAGSFDNAMAGLRHIKKAGGTILISFTVTRITIDDIEYMALLGKKMHCTVRYNPLFYTGNAVCFEDDLAVPVRDELAAYERIYALSRKYPGHITGAYLERFLRLKAVRSTTSRAASQKVSPCVAGTFSCAVRPDGWVTPCEYLWHEKVGNVRQDTFLSIWKRSPQFARFRKALQLKPAEPAYCTGCEYELICVAGHRCIPYYGARNSTNKRRYCLKRGVRNKERNQQDA